MTHRDETKPAPRAPTRGYEIRKDQVGGRPRLRPLYGLPPWHYVDDRVVVVTFRADRDAIREVVPEVLEPDPGDLVSAGFFVCPSVSGLGAHAFTIFSIPVRYEGEGFQFTPYLYTDTDRSLAVYRECHGWPGVLGQTQIEELPGGFRARLSRGGHEILVAEGAVAGEPLALKSEDFPPWIIHRELMSPDGLQCDIAQLVASVSRFTNIQLKAGQGSLRMSDPGDDPVARLAPLEVTGVLYGTLDDVYPEKIWAVRSWT